MNARRQGAGCDQRGEFGEECALAFRRCVAEPEGQPEAAQRHVAKDERARGDRARNATHRAVIHDSAAERDALRQMIGGLAADRVDREPNLGLVGCRGDLMFQIRAVDQHNVAAHRLDVCDGALTSDDIHGAQPATLGELNEVPTDRRVCGVLHHPLSRLQCDEVREQQCRSGRIHREHRELPRVAKGG